MIRAVAGVLAMCFAAWAAFDSYRVYHMTSAAVPPEAGEYLQHIHIIGGVAVEPLWVAAVLAVIAIAFAGVGVALLKK